MTPVWPGRRARSSAASSRSPSPTTRSAPRSHEAEVPPLLPALAYLTGDLSLLRDDLRPDPLLLAHAAGRADRRAAGRGPRARARDARSGSATAAAARRRRRRTPTCCGSWSSRSAAADMAEYLPLLEEELALPRRGPARARAGTRPTSRPTSTSSVVDHRRGHVGPARRAPAAAGRRRRSSILEKNDDVGGTWLENTLSRAAGSTTRTTTTATRSRSATTGRSTSRPRTCCSTTSGAAPTTFGAARPHPVRHRGACRRRGPTTDAALDGARARRRRHARRRSRPTRSISAVGQLNRPSFPDIDGPRLVRRARRSTRRGGTTTSTCAASGSR